MARRVLLALLLGLLVLPLAGCQDDDDDGGGQVDVTVSGTGANFDDYIDDTTFDRLEVEVDVADDAAVTPEDASLDTLLARLANRVTKPSGVDWTQSTRTDETIPQNELQSVYTVNDLVGLQTAHQQHASSGSTAGMYVMYLNGSFEDQDGNVRDDVLGVSYAADAFAIFKERLLDALGPAASDQLTRKEYEEAILVHEVGHLLGLVDLTLPMRTDHEDPDHEFHDEDDQCVMFFQIDFTNPIIKAQNGQVDDEFDIRCREDIEDGGGQAP